MAITTASARLGADAPTNNVPIELRPNWNANDAQAIVYAIYRQVLGNDYLLDSERLKGAESLLQNGKISIREFVRILAKSELYKKKFFYNCFQTRTIELNFKHLLGRAPYDEAEIIEHLDRYQNEGYEADIDSYIDSAEYDENFGDNLAPYLRGLTTQKGQNTAGFPHMFKLYRGYANSDRSQLGGTAPQLVQELAQSQATAVVAPSGDNDGWAYRRTNGMTPTQRAFGRSKVNSGLGTRLYRVEISGLCLPRYPRIRQSSRVLIVSYDQLSKTLQKVNKEGGKVASVTPA